MFIRRQLRVLLAMLRFASILANDIFIVLKHPLRVVLNILSIIMRPSQSFVYRAIRQTRNSVPGHTTYNTSSPI